MDTRIQGHCITMTMTSGTRDLPDHQRSSTVDLDGTELAMIPVVAHRIECIFLCLCPETFPRADRAGARAP